MKTCKVVFKGVMLPSLKEVFLSEAPPYAEVTVFGPGPADEKEIAQIADADFLVVHKAASLPEILEKTTNLKLFQTLSIGTDHLPMALAKTKGIPVANAGGTTATSVAEHTVLLMMATLRSLPLSIDAVHQTPPKMEVNVETVHRMTGKTVGIVGLGNIGRQVAKMVSGFTDNILFYDAFDIPEAVQKELKVKQVPLDELLATADIVSIHVPNMESTRKMMNREKFSKMKPNAIIVNTSRGAVIDEAAMIQALQEKQIAGAGLDVWEKEPPDPSNPLLHMSNVVATPHIAAEAWDDYVLLFKLSWENIGLVMDGKAAKNIVPQ